MSDYKYENPVDRLDDFIDKMSRGIMPQVDDLTFKEIEIRMRELASSIDEDADEEDLETIVNDATQLRQKAKESKRKAAREDVAYFTLTEEQSKKLREEMSSSWVRSAVSDYNIPEDKLNEDKELNILIKRKSKLRRCYYHADDWINAMKTILDIVEYDARNYPWMSKQEYYRAFNNGTIKLNVIVPVLFMDYHTPIKDPVILKAIFNGETIIEEQTIDKSNKVRNKDDEVAWIHGIDFTESEVDSMQNLAASGYDTPINHILKNSHKSLYDRFMPVGKSNTPKAGVVNELLKSYKHNMKFDGTKMVPYKTSDIINYIHKQNEGKLNHTLTTATTKFLTALSSKPEFKFDTSFNTNEVLVNADAALKEAQIMAAIKVANNGTK